MPRKYNPEQKDSALEMLKKCEWTKKEYKKIEKSLYNKFRDNKSEIEFNDYKEFIECYVKKIKKQNGKCFYCGLEGDIKKTYGKYFTKGKRKKCGERLEIDKKDPKVKYSANNLVLACYPCNNAKSNVFTCDEFIIIGAVIGALKKKD